MESLKRTSVRFHFKQCSGRVVRIPTDETWNNLNGIASALSEVAQSHGGLNNKLRIFKSKNSKNIRGPGVFAYGKIAAARILSYFAGYSPSLLCTGKFLLIVSG